MGRTTKPVLRASRRWVIARAAHAAQRLAPALPCGAIDALESGVARAGPHLPVLARMVAENLRAAGLYDDGVVRAYFAQVARQLANVLRMVRLGKDHQAVRRLARSQCVLDASVSRARWGVGPGQGVVIAPAHVCNYLLWLVRLDEEVPVRVYLRWSKDERKREMKRRWLEAAGLDAVLEPPSAAAAGVRAGTRHVRGGGALVLLPDLAQKVGAGVPVSLLGRQVFLPAGAATIALMADAPIVPLFGRLCDGREVLYATEPVVVGPRPRDRAARQAAIRTATQAWARRFDAFLRDCPQAWFFWGDKRWTRVFHDDPRFTPGAAPHQHMEAIAIAAKETA